MVFRASLLVGAVLLGWGVARAADPRPNVLFIVSDDLNCFLGCYGDPIVKTPHIDRLAARGVRFERAYCAFPLCGPSRNSFLTGLYPNATGIQGNGQIFRQSIPTQLSMPQAFRLAGYFAARIGKMYHYNVPASVGTNGHDDPGSWELELNPAGCDRIEEEPMIFSLQPGQFGGTLSWYASPKEDREHTDGIMADDAAWVLERCARDRTRPFFLAVGFFRPHTPYVAPKTYFEMYPEAEMPLVTGVAEDQEDVPKAALASRKAEQDRMTDHERRQARRSYCASISFLDAQVGRILEALDKHGLADNTIVVFTSDHGYHMGEHGLYQKMSLFEESARVPLLIAAPGRCQAGGVAQAPVSQVDIFPTLSALCGVEPPENLQGQSLVPLLEEPAAAGRGWAVTQVIRNARVGGLARKSDLAADGKAPFFGYSLRTPRWRYTEWDEGRGGRELYDHDADPKELTNLAEAPAHAATVAELSKQLAAAVQTTLPAGGAVPDIKPGLWSPNLTNP